MKIRTFEMERWQSTWENQVEYNLSESGVHPMTLAELGLDAEELLRIRLGYSQSNGTERLRALAAELYAGTTTRNFLATNGGAEANFLALLKLIEPGDEAVLLLPNYMQTHGLVEAFGGRVVPVWLRPESRWVPDPDEVRSKVGARTKLIVICNPNNPTGAVFGQDIIKAIASAADRYGSWILADEVYRGAELDGERTPSFWGFYPRTLVTHSLSKSYALPGLRIGWILGPEDMIAQLWAYHDYTSIAPGILSDAIACRALEMRERLYARTRTYLRGNLPVLQNWMDQRPGKFAWVPPRAGAIAMIRYKHRVNSSVLAERLRAEKSTLIVPGDQFLMDGYMRLGYGSERFYLEAGLKRLMEVLDSYS